MAQQIVQQHPKVSVTAVIEHAFDRAISERRKVSEWFRSCHGSIGKDASDQRHLYFIGVLEGAFATLCPFTEFKMTSGTTRGLKTVEVGSLPLHNAFDGLTVEEPSEDLQQPEVGTKPHNNHHLELPKIASVKIEQNEDDIEEDFFFAVECFLEEVHDIRSMIKDTWDLYKRTGYDLVIATLVTNAAIDKSLSI